MPRPPGVAPAVAAMPGAVYAPWIEGFDPVPEPPAKPKNTKPQADECACPILPAGTRAPLISREQPE